MQMDILVICVESRGTRFDHCRAGAAIGRDECINLMLPVEALQLLKEDAAAREQGRADESEGEKLDPETTLLQRVLADAEQAEISAFSAIGVLTTAATMMVSQCYDLTKLGDDHADA